MKTICSTLSHSKDVTITCSSNGRGHIVLGDNLGLVHLFDRQYKRDSFKAYNINTSHVLQLKQSSFLGTIGVSSLIFIEKFFKC